MVNLICGKTLDFDLLHPTDGMCRPYVNRSCVAEAQEPVSVHVRVRRPGGSFAGLQPACDSNPDFGKLPVGAILDCYV